jgi:hypothetical protein
MHRWLLSLSTVGLVGWSTAALADDPPATQAKKEVKVRVTAPGTKVENSDEKLEVNAPFVRVYRDKKTGAVRVDAPFTRVEKDGKGTVAVDAPFVVVRTSEDDGQDDPKAAKSGSQEVVIRKVQKKAPRKVAFVGVSTEAVPESLAAQFPATLSHEQGLVIVQVAPDSPAEKAGLKANDVLLAYGDQKLFSGEQLAKLVRADKAGNKVSLSLLRAGKIEKIDITLGEREFSGDEDVLFPVPPGVAPGRIRVLTPQENLRDRLRALHERQAELHKHDGDKDGKKDPKVEKKVQVKRRFTSMSLSSSGDNRFKAHIEWEADGGKKQLDLDGTRDEIRKGLQEVPEDVRKPLLRVLDESDADAKKGAFRLRLGPNDDDLGDPFGIGIMIGSDDGFKWWTPGEAISIEAIIDELPKEMPKDVRNKIQDSLRQLQRTGVDVNKDIL